MSRRKKHTDEGSTKASWLVTYSDLVTLLLCFFVLLYAISTVDNLKFKKFIASFRSEPIDVLLEDSSNSIIDFDENSQPPIRPQSIYSEEEEEKFNKITDELKEIVANKGLNASVSVVKEHEGVLIRFHDGVLFDKGSAQLKSNALQVLSDMSEVLKKHERMVKVEGHTDNDPIIGGGIYPTNWELSTARAVNVVKFFVEGVPSQNRISPELLQAAGYGEYHPLYENDTEENKTQNRRIEIVIVKETIDKTSKNN